MEAANCDGLSAIRPSSTLSLNSKFSTTTNVQVLGYERM